MYGQMGQNNHFLSCKCCPDGNVWMDGTDGTECMDGQDRWDSTAVFKETDTMCKCRLC